MHQPEFIAGANAQLVFDLNEDKIQGFLSKGLDLTVSKEELSNPRPEVIIMIYEAFLKDFGFNVDNLSQPYWPVAEELESPESYEEVFSLANVCGLMRSIAERSGICNFSLKDILAPKRKRTRHILSSLAKFWNFYGEQLKLWLQIKLEFASIAEEKRMLKEEIESKMEAIQETKLFLLEFLPQRAEMVEKCNECITLLENKKQEKEGITNSYYDIKQKGAEIKADLDNINVAISSLHARKKELEGKIVSHDQMKELEELAQKSQLYRMKKEEIFCGIDEYNNLKGLHLRINSELDATRELLESTSKTTARSREVLSEIELLRITARADEEEVSNLSKQQEKKHLELETLGELTRKEEMKHMKRANEIKKLISQQESCLQELHKKQETLEMEVRKEKLLKKMKNHANNREKFEQQLISKYLSAAENVEEFIKNEQENIQKMEDLLVMPNKVLKE